jgi:hypothetical protein
MSIDKKTMERIEDEGVMRRGSELVTWNCGCEQRSRLFLCQFHEGYDAAMQESVT